MNAIDIAFQMTSIWSLRGAHTCGGAPTKHQGVGKPQARRRAQGAWRARVCGAYKKRGNGDLLTVPTAPHARPGPPSCPGPRAIQGGSHTRAVKVAPAVPCPAPRCPPSECLLTQVTSTPVERPTSTPSPHPRRWRTGPASPSACSLPPAGCQPAGLATCRPCCSHVCLELQVVDEQRQQRQRQDEAEEDGRGALRLVAL